MSARPSTLERGACLDSCLYSIVHGRAEFETTDLGLAAYEGRTEDVRAFI
ncbi:hypothetical protein [Archangium sp.]|nr:hypothetical protein [Archangium sp.]